MIFTAKEYIEAPPLKFPYKSKIGLVIDELKCQCNKCRKYTRDLRGYFVENEYQNASLEVRAAGVCDECKLITSLQTRFYKNRRILVKDKNDNWVEGYLSFKNSSILYKIFTIILFYFHRFFGSKPKDK